MPAIDKLFNEDTAQVLAGDEKVQDNFLKLFIDNVQRGIETMKTAADNNDIEKLRKAAHLLRGTTGILKNNIMHSIASGIETAAAEGRTDKAVGLSIEFEHEFERFKASAEGQ